MGGGYEIDLVGGEAYEDQSNVQGISITNGDEATVDPYRSDSQPDSVSGVEGEDGTIMGSTAGLAGLGAPMATHPSTSPTIAATGMIDGGSSSRQAGPLPPKPRSSLDREGNLRIANPANPASLPTLPQGATVDGSPNVGRNSEARTRTSQDHPRQPTFRRHEDAGRYRAGEEQQEVVDLPPLYTDINRDG